MKSKDELIEECEKQDLEIKRVEKLYNKAVKKKDEYIKKSGSLWRELVQAKKQKLDSIKIIDNYKNNVLKEKRNKRYTDEIEKLIEKEEYSLKNTEESFEEKLKKEKIYAIKYLLRAYTEQEREIIKKAIIKELSKEEKIIVMFSQHNILYSRTKENSSRKEYMFKKTVLGENYTNETTYKVGKKLYNIAKNCIILLYEAIENGTVADQMIKKDNVRK